MPLRGLFLKNNFLVRTSLFLKEVTVRCFLACNTRKKSRKIVLISDEVDEGEGGNIFF